MGITLYVWTDDQLVNLGYVRQNRTQEGRTKFYF